jgi:hypothetical protein
MDDIERDKSTLKPEVEFANKANSQNYIHIFRAIGSAIVLVVIISIFAACSS